VSLLPPIIYSSNTNCMSLGRGEIDLGLERMHALLERLGSPHVALMYRGVRLVHVTGTNGKGSASEMIANGLLVDPKNKVGIFTSPFLVTERDAIRVFSLNHHTMIPEEEWEDIREGISALMIDMDRESTPTEFEILFATGLMYFASKVDISHIVIEVGMGGRLDATNVFRDVVSSCPSLSPVVCVITSISLDHQAFLGNTVEEICREKCGIFTPGCIVVINSEISPSCRSIIDDMFCAVGGRNLISVDYNSGTTRLVTPPLHGDHQKQLMAIAVETVYAVLEDETKFPIESVLNAIQHTYIPGRLEFRNDFPKVPFPVLLDGAHNEESAEALRRFVDHTVTSRGIEKVFWIIATSSGRESIVPILLRKSDSCLCINFEVTTEWVKCYPAHELGKIAAQHCASAGAIDGKIDDAIQYVSMAESADVTKKLIVVAGSLYLVRNYLQLVSSSPAGRGKSDEQTLEGNQLTIGA
jgi:folylpolyglutamate synthase/dihydrofolate synthase